MHKTICLLALVLTCVACVAQADTRLVYSGDSGQFVVSIRAGEIRIDDTNGGWQLYRKKANTIYAVDPSKNSYTRMDEDVAATLHERMANLRAKIEAQIEKLPPNRRDIARSVLQDQIPGFTGKPQKVTLDSTGGHDKVSGIKCEIVQVVRDGEPAERMCIATAAALGMPDDEFATLKAMFGLMHTMLAGTGFEAVGLPYLDLSGMPIRFHARKGHAQRTLTQVAHTALDDKLFRVPDTYIEQIPGETTRQ